MFKKGVPQADIARKLDVTPAAISQWHASWSRGGVKRLKSKGNSGFPSRLTEKKKKQLKAAILKGPKAYGYDTELWTLERIAAVMKKVAKVSFGHTRVWQIVLSLGFSCQKPQVRSKERDENSIRHWKLKEFPKLKKMG